jgi:hypothetical protein
MQVRACWKRAVWFGFGTVACASAVSPPVEQVAPDASGSDGAAGATRDGSAEATGKECFPDDAGGADAGDRNREGGTTNVCGNGLCELWEDCRACCPDCACQAGEVCTLDGACGKLARCGIEWECGSGDSFGVFVPCGACPAGQTCVLHHCE